MLTLLCILLYLSEITSPNTYWTSEIEAIEQQNQAEIQQIESDQQLTNQIVYDYQDDASWIDFYDDPGGW